MRANIILLSYLDHPITRTFGQPIAILVVCRNLIFDLVGQEKITGGASGFPEALGAGHEGRQNMG